MSISQTRPFTILCVASYHKGDEFIRECKRQGCRVLLLTSLSVGREVWPLESIDELFLMPDVEKQWNMEDVIKSVSFLARDRVIDRIVPLDDFDLEKAATLREHLRTPGMGETTTRYFRDKLAMRMQAQEAGINVPEFRHVLNHERLREFAARTPAPWVLKPRFEASAVGIQKIRVAEELWPALDALSDRQSFFVLERFVPGDIYHVDSIVAGQQILFAIASRYGQPPLNVAHDGGVFSTSTIERGTPDERALQAINRRVLSAMGLRRGVSHTEFIKGRADHQFYFLETSARVGGANIAELIEAATGLNLWAEWAKLEVRPDYKLPTPREDYAGLLVSLARQECPDTSRYNDPEIVWRMNKSAHAGLIVKSPSLARVEQL
ncbi:MAG: ATP-grasp domain-containing protein, partial [Acidobacteria bacterium]|nr:ATP-grasp domain-containing protein [Acidobacteriota bacterium]